MRRTRGILIALLCAASRTAASQDVGYAPVERPQVFLERSYFAPVTPTGKNVLFEGYASGHYFLFNHLNDGVWQANGGWTLAMPISMVFLVRMTNDFSSPVRTPSYQIRPLYLQAFHLTRDADRRSFRLIGAAAGFEHYSNGQAGCTYLGYVVNTSRSDCAISDAALAAQRIPNTTDGSFSTNFIPLRLDVRFGALRGPHDPVDVQTSVGVELQLHPFNKIPGSLDAAQASTYGQHQFTLRAEHEKRLATTASRWIGVWRVAGDYTKRFGGGAASPPTFGGIETSYSFDKAGALGPFVRLNAGRDYYNIRYATSGRFIVAGIRWDLGRLDVLETKNAR